MKTVDVYAYFLLGEPSEDFVIRETGKVYPLNASIDDEDRWTTAQRVVRGDFLPCGPLDDDAVLIATYKIEDN